MRTPSVLLLVLLTALVMSCSGAPERDPGVAPGSGAPESGTSGGAARAAPEVIRLPNGFAPEGIALGSGSTAYLGDRESGAIQRVDLATGHGTQLHGPTGRGVQGMKFSADKLYVAGRSAGDARVIDANTGQLLVSLPLVAQPTEDNNLVNDVLLTEGAWWLTESRNPVLYRIALPSGGSLPTSADVRTVPLTGDWANRRGINANGIVPTPDGTGLLVVQSNTGKLFRVDPASGRAAVVDLGGESLDDGDGLLLAGRTLFVAQNESNTLTSVELDPAGTRGRVTARMADPRFDAPTTIAAWGGRLYLPNARFDQDPGPSVEYTVTSVPMPGGS